MRKCNFEVACKAVRMRHTTQILIPTASLLTGTIEVNELQNGEPVVINFFAIGLIFVFLLAVVAIAFLFFLPWLRAFTSGANISLFHVIGMRLRRTNANLIIDAMIAYKHRDDAQAIASLESCYLAYRNQITDLDSFLTVYEQHRNKFQRKP